MIDYMLIAARKRQKDAYGCNERWSAKNGHDYSVFSAGVFGAGLTAFSERLSLSRLRLSLPGRFSRLPPCSPLYSLLSRPRFRLRRFAGILFPTFRALCLFGRL